MMDLESAARIATASDDPGCPFRLIAEEIAAKEARKAEGDALARMAEEARKETVARWGEFGMRGREIFNQERENLR